jgi:ribonuclease-3
LKDKLFIDFALAHNLQCVPLPLLKQALTHRSFGVQHYERLEFLGDAVLDLATSAWLYQKYGDISEGTLTRMRTKMVRQETLHCIALRLGIPSHLRLGEGERIAGGAQRASILADVVEALIGALFVSNGYERAAQWLLAQYSALPDMVEHLHDTQDAKTKLQEIAQARKWPLPLYQIVATSGAAHALSFTIECVLQCKGKKVLRAQTTAASKRSAEQMAAQHILNMLALPRQE